MVVTVDENASAVAGKTQQSNPSSPSTTSSPTEFLNSGIPTSPVSMQSLSPSLRHPPTRPLSPDLPTRDALYLFSNYSSYMRSPGENADGIDSSEDFKDSIRLLDYARGKALAAQPYANVNILHVKYRFIAPSGAQEENLTMEKHQYHRDPAGRLRNPVPQPFSVLHDPVIKIDYQNNGVFEPLPAQAIYGHIANACQPPPRIIVVSYVGSKVTENHISALATWALRSSPPTYVFSPLETRIRESRSVEKSLRHAIPMSMYAWPPGVNVATPTTNSFSPVRSLSSTSSHLMSGATHIFNPESTSPFRSDPLVPVPPIHRDHSQLENKRNYPTDPVATLTIVTSDEDKPHLSPADSGSPNARSLRPVLSIPDRIPLWALAPGVGVLQGSTSASIGVKLADFSAINLVQGSSNETRRGAAKTISTAEAGVRTTPLDLRELDTVLVTPTECITRPSSTAPPSRKVPALPRPHSDDGRENVLRVHLTPPDGKHPKDLACVQANTTTHRQGHGSAPELVHSPRSWPAPANKVQGWRRGRKEQMEDILGEIGCGFPGGGRRNNNGGHDGRADAGPSETADVGGSTVTRPRGMLVKLLCE